MIVPVQNKIIYTLMFMQKVSIIILQFLNVYKPCYKLNRNHNRKSSEFETPPNAARRIALSSTQPPPIARPLGLYPAYPWVPGREIEAEGEGWKRVGRRCRGRKGCRSQGKQHNPLLPYHLTAN